MRVGIGFFSPSIYYYRTFFRSFQSVLLSGLIRDEPIGEVLSASTGGLSEEPIAVPDEVLSSSDGASVSCLSAHTREEEDEDFLVVAIDPGRRQECTDLTLLRSMQFLYINISIRVDRLHAGIKEIPRHDLDLETSCVNNITTQRN